MFYCLYFNLICYQLNFLRLTETQLKMEVFVIVAS